MEHAGLFQQKMRSTYVDLSLSSRPCASSWGFAGEWIRLFLLQKLLICPGRERYRVHQDADVEGFFKNILLPTRKLTTVLLRFHLRVLITDFIQSITLISQSFRKASLCSDPRHGSVSRPHWIIPSAFVRVLSFRGRWLYFQIQPLRHFCVILRGWQPDVSSAGPVAFSGTLS